MPAATVIVRVKNEARSLQRALDSLHAQTVPVEIVVVDSGSSDGSVEIARRAANRVIEIPASEFTFGHALNLGAAAASGEFVFALSAHCSAPQREWVERALSHYDDARVAATHGCLHLPDGTPLREVFLQDAAHARAHPYWGFSNHASSWRADVWRRLRFDEEIDACEDKEWAWRVLAEGRAIAVDPLLDVPKPHRRRAGMRALYGRSRREAGALAPRTGVREYAPGQALAKWWNVPVGDARSPVVRRMNPYRLAEIAGRWAGERSGG
jgi:rhamnosyltransferase